MTANELSDDPKDGPTPKDIRFLRKLGNVISYARIHCEDESKTYGILNVLLPSFTDLFSSMNPDVSIFTTPQDKLVGPEQMRVASNERPVRVIPDMTVKIARMNDDLEEEGDHQLVLLIEAKRLCVDTSTGLDPWFDIAAGIGGSTQAFNHNLGQLMLQSWCSWSTFPEQDYLYLKFLSGPYVTVVKFSRPPWALSGLPTSPTVGQAEGSPPKKRRRVEEEDEQEASPSLHKLIPRKYAPELVIWNRHIFADPLDSTRGLSAALRYALHRVTEDIVKGFDQGFQVEQSSIFNFAGFADHPFEETKVARKSFADTIGSWYERMELSGLQFDHAAAADKAEDARYEDELLTRRSPHRAYLRERQVYTPTGELIPSPSISEDSPYIPTPEKAKQSRRPSNPPSSPSPAPAVELPMGPIPIYSTRYQLRGLNSRPQ